MAKPKKTITDPKIAKLRRVIEPHLSKPQRLLLNMMPVEVRKNDFIFRVPMGMFAVENVWELVKKICKKEGIKIRRASVHATLGELDELLKHTVWLWQDWIPIGFVTLLVGDPGVGKSVIALDWLRYVVVGDKFPLVEKSVKAANAIWVEAENAQQLLMTRSKDLKIPPERVFLPIFNGQLLSQPDLEQDEDKAQIVELIKAKKPRIVIVDSLGGAIRGGENKVEDVKPIMEFLSQLARDSENTAVVLLHHMKKGQGEDATVALSRVRGSTLISAYCRSIIALEKSRPNEIKMTNIKNNLAPQPDALSLVIKHKPDNKRSIEKIEYSTFVEAPKKLTRVQLCVNWVVEYLGPLKEPIRMKDLILAAEPVGFSRQNLYNAKAQLEQVLSITGTGNEAYWELAVDSKSITMIQKAVDSKVAKPSSN